MKHLLSGFRWQNLAGGLMTIRLSVRLFKIHHCCLWEFRAYIYEVGKLADMVREVVQEMHLHKVEIRFIDKMLCNFWLDLHFIFINAKMLCSRRMIVPSGVTLLFFLFVQSKLLFQGFRDLLCRFTGAESNENILVTMKLLQIIIHVLSVSNGSRELASSPVFGRRFGSVWVITRPKTWTTMSWRVCYPDHTETLCFLAGQDLDRGSILQFLHFWLQFSIWVLIVSWHDVYVDCAVQADLSPPSFRIEIQLILLSGCQISIDFRWNSRVFNSDSTNIGRIANPKAGGERAAKTAQSANSSCHDTIRTQILNWSKTSRLALTRFWGWNWPKCQQSGFFMW